MAEYSITQLRKELKKDGLDDCILSLSDKNIVASNIGSSLASALASYFSGVGNLVNARYKKGEKTFTASRKDWKSFVVRSLQHSRKEEEKNKRATEENSDKEKIKNIDGSVVYTDLSLLEVGDFAEVKNGSNDYLSRSTTQGFVVKINAKNVLFENVSQQNRGEEIYYKVWDYQYPLANIVKFWKPKKTAEVKPAQVETPKPISTAQEESDLDETSLLNISEKDFNELHKQVKTEKSFQIDFYDSDFNYAQYLKSKSDSSTNKFLRTTFDERSKYNSMINKTAFLAFVIAKIDDKTDIPSVTNAMSAFLFMKNMFENTLFNFENFENADSLDRYQTIQSKSDGILPEVPAEILANFETKKTENNLEIPDSILQEFNDLTNNETPKPISTAQEESENTEKAVQGVKVKSISSLIDDHLTDKDKNKLKAFIESGLENAKVNMSTYFILSRRANVFQIQDHKKRIFFIEVKSDQLSPMDISEKNKWVNDFVSIENAKGTIAWEIVKIAEEGNNPLLQLKFYIISLKRLNENPELWTKVYNSKEEIISKFNRIVAESKQNNLEIPDSILQEFNDLTNNETPKPIITAQEESETSQKQAWEMTFEEFKKEKQTSMSETEYKKRMKETYETANGFFHKGGAIRALHHKAVKKAFLEGKSIPANLKEYVDLLPEDSAEQILAKDSAEQILAKEKFNLMQGKKEKEVALKAVKQCIREYVGDHFLFLINYLDGGYEDYVYENHDKIIHQVSFGKKRLRSVYNYLPSSIDDIIRSCAETLEYVKESVPNWHLLLDKKSVSQNNEFTAHDDFDEEEYDEEEYDEESELAQESMRSTSEMPILQNKTYMEKYNINQGHSYTDLSLLEVGDLVEFVETNNSQYHIQAFVTKINRVNVLLENMKITKEGQQQVFNYECYKNNIIKFWKPFVFSSETGRKIHESSMKSSIIEGKKEQVYLARLDRDMRVDFLGDDAQTKIRVGDYVLIKTQFQTGVVSGFVVENNNGKVKVEYASSDDELNFTLSQSYYPTKDVVKILSPKIRNKPAQKCLHYLQDRKIDQNLGKLGINDFWNKIEVVRNYAVQDQDNHYRHHADVFRGIEKLLIILLKDFDNKMLSDLLEVFTDLQKNLPRKITVVQDWINILQNQNSPELSQTMREVKEMLDAKSYTIEQALGNYGINAQNAFEFLMNLPNRLPKSNYNHFEKKLQYFMNQIVKSKSNDSLVLVFAQELCNVFISEILYNRSKYKAITDAEVAEMQYWATSAMWVLEDSEDELVKLNMLFGKKDNYFSKLYEDRFGKSPIEAVQEQKPKVNAKQDTLASILQTPNEEEAKNIVVQYIQKQFENNQKAKLNDIADKGSSYGLKKDDKFYQELTEFAVVDYLKQNKFSNLKNFETSFENIVEFYDKRLFSLQLRDNVRSELQQYSTPPPLALLAQWFLDFSDGTKTIFEPTAGNGMLLFAANPDSVMANEIDKNRFENLSKQEFLDVFNEDAINFVYEPIANHFDAVITNPPFGKLPKTEVDGYSVTNLGHLLSIKALQTLKVGGNAVLIVGGFLDIQNMAKNAMILFNYLTVHFDHIYPCQIDGSLYAPMGTTYPVIAILLGNKLPQTDKSRLKNLWYAQNLAKLKTWEEVKAEFVQAKSNMEQGITATPKLTNRIQKEAKREYKPYEDFSEYENLLPMYDPKKAIKDLIKKLKIELNVQNN